MGTSLQIADPFLFNDWFFNSWKRLSINSYDLRIILSIASKLILLFVNLRTSEVILFSNFIFFYWHFVEILWTFIFLVFYKLFLSFPFIGFSFSKMPSHTTFSKKRLSFCACMKKLGFLFLSSSTPLPSVHWILCTFLSGNGWLLFHSCPVHRLLIFS